MNSPSLDSVGDTIFSLSSAPGRAGVSVFRVSGITAGVMVRALTLKACPAPRRAVVRRFYARDKSVIDEGLVLWMPSPNSFTGEDSAEFHCHGSPAVIEAMSTALFESGARQATAGEFTRRAFNNGKMDLTEAEGLADLIDAETEGQRLQAVRQMQGGLRQIYEGWREGLLDALAQIEGEIDFPDEADIPDLLSHQAYPVLTGLINNMDLTLSDGMRGEHVRSGLDIAIIGAPNAGKSSLINALAGRDAAIISSEAGTTRDIVDVQMVMGGLPVRVSDTAGLRDTDNLVEAEGVRRAVLRAKDSDIRILVHDSSGDVWDEAGLSLLRGGDFLVLNKIDLISERAEPPFLPGDNFDQIYPVSIVENTGVEALYQALETAVVEQFSPTRDPGLTRARHRDCVETACASLRRGREKLVEAPELAGDDIRSALHALRELAGETDIEAVFDRIFSRFCVGK